MVNTVCEALESVGYRYQKIVEKQIQSVFKLGLAMENGRVDCFIDIRIPDKQVLISAVCPVVIGENKRKPISEFISRANSNLIIGAFDLDFSDGELKYKCNYVYDDTYPQSEEVFLKNLFTSFHMLDKYMPGIMAVLYANLDPRIAISQIEGVTEPTMN